MAVMNHNRWGSYVTPTYSNAAQRFAAGASN